jgi:hypothetical protein
MKIYRDIDEVIEPTRVPKKLWQYEDSMKEVPKKWDNNSKKNKKKFRG